MPWFEDFRNYTYIRMTDKYKAMESNYSYRYPTRSNYSFKKKHNLVVPILKNVSYYWVLHAILCISTIIHKCNLYIIDFETAQIQFEQFWSSLKYCKYNYKSRNYIQAHTAKHVMSRPRHQIQNDTSHIVVGDNSFITNCSHAHYIAFGALVLKHNYSFFDFSSVHNSLVIREGWASEKNLTHSTYSWSPSSKLSTELQ